MSAESLCEISATTFWPTIFFHLSWQDHAKYSQGIIDFLYELRAKAQHNIASGVAVRAKSGSGVYESTFDLFTKPHPGLQQLAQFIGQTLASAVSHMEGGRVQPFQLQMVIADSWYHISNQGGHHDAHYHHNYSWCGIYYLEIGTSGAALNAGAPNGGSRFYSPLLLGGGYRDDGNRYLNDYFDAPIQNGMLLLFPSYLQHSGLPYQGEKDRIVIAFNARVFRKPEGGAA